MAFNALLPGEHDWMKNASMSSSATPGYTPPPSRPVPQLQTRQGMNAPAKGRNPVMNALNTVFKYGAPEAYQQGQQMRTQEQMRNALAMEDYAGAAKAAMQGGDFETGFKLREYTQGQDAQARKQEAQGVYQLFTSMQPAQINEYAMQDPAGFERMTGMTSEEYLASAQQMQQVGMTPEQFHQYVIGKAQAELGITPETPEPYTLAPGARRYGPNGELIAENPVAAKPTEQWQEYTPPGGIPGLFQRNSATGEIKRVAAPQSGGIRIGADGAIQIGGPVEGLGYGTAPKGQESAIVRGPDGQPVVSPGPQQEQFRKANNFLKSKQRQIGIVRDDIRRASELVKDPMATGPLGVIGRELPIVGAITPGGRLASRIKTIKTNIGFDKIDEMRQNSPTGGALGNVTEKEIDFLQAVAGELDNAQSDEDVDYVLRRIDAFYADLEQQYAEAFALDYPTLADTAQFRAQTNQQVQDLNDLLEFMTPEERALFEGEQ